MAVLDVIIVALILLFYHPILSVCFNEEAARVRGIPVTLVTFVLTILTALTIVLLTQIVGIVLVIAILSIPGAAVSRFSGSLLSMMAWATMASLFFMVSGLVISYGPRLPVGATIIQIAALGYGMALLVHRFSKRRGSVNE
jgi:zinc transport system permease protein